MFTRMRHLPVRTALGIALALLGIYLLTASGHFYAIDEVQMYALTEALGTRGTFVLYDPGPGKAPIYSKYGMARDSPSRRCRCTG
jgi:hypothetical protein